MIEKFIRKFGRFCVRRYYRRIRIDGAELIPQTGPVLLCANHPNSLFDPIVVGIAARRPVRFLAKASLFQIPVLGAVMRALGTIPAFRGRDGARDVRRNVKSLDAATQVLMNNEAIGIFPEGQSHDRLGLEMVRSGVARMSASAREQGLSGLQVAPIGINYEDKERFRSDVWIQIGQPIDVDKWFDERDGTPKQLQRQLTDELDRRMKKCIIHLNDRTWEPWLSTVEVMLEGIPLEIEQGGGVDFADSPLVRRKAIAHRMNQFLQTDIDHGQQLGKEIKQLESMLHEQKIELSSYANSLSSRNTTWGFMLTVLWATLLFPVAVLGTLHHIVPFAITRAISTRLHSQVNRTDVSFYRLLLSIPVYLLAYVVIGVLIAWAINQTTAIVWLLIAPVAGIVAFEYWPALGALRKKWRQRTVISRLRASLAPVETEFHRLAKEISEVARNSAGEVVQTKVAASPVD